MKLFRWKYVLPRAALLIVVVLTLRLGLDPLIKWAIITGGETAVGAKVELAEVRTSLLDGEILLRGCAVANPNSPLKNLGEAKESRLKIDLDALLHQRLVIQDGAISGIQFDTDRTESGALVETAADTIENPSILDTWLASASEYGEVWLSQLDDRFNTNLVDQLKSPRLAKKLEQRWPEQYDELRAKVQSLMQQAQELEQGIRQVRANPLRNLDGLGGLQQQLAGTQKQLQSVTQQIQSLPKQGEADREAVLAARKHDEEFVRRQLQLTQLDGNGITQSLLGETTSQGIATALDWVRWARRRIPAKKTKPMVARSRGTNILYGPAKPRYLVEQLRLEGQAQLDGQPISLFGMLTNVSSDPHLVVEPTRLALRGKGNDFLAIDLTIDRRSSIAKDQLLLVCPQFTLPGRTVGNAQKLAIAMAPSTAAFQMDVSLTDDQLTGEIQFHQAAAAWSLESASQKNKQLVSVLDGALEGVEQIEASVTIAGTLQQPRVSLQSDLGSQLATGLNAGVKRLMEEKSQDLLAATREKVDAQLQRLAKTRMQAQEELLAQLGKHQELLSQLAAFAKGGHRISIPQLGSTLRPDTQRK